VKALSLTLALAAGLAGGILSHYLWPAVVQAQSRPQTPQEIRAQSFVLEDANGRTLGTFSPETQRNGIPERDLSGSIRLFDERGREIWRSPTRGIFPATE
jgi:hypothetical protein